MSYYIRSKYIQAEYCGSISKIQSNREHEEFTNCIEELIDVLQVYNRIKHF